MNTDDIPPEWRSAAAKAYTDAFRRLVDTGARVDVWGEVAAAVALAIQSTAHRNALDLADLPD